jgi:hypothetical protein
MSYIPPIEKSRAYVYRCKTLTLRPVPAPFMPVRDFSIGGRIELTCVGM